MLRFLGRARAFSLATLLVFAATIPASLQALTDADDVLCQPRFVVHDENAHRVGADPEHTRAPQHCAVCHWLQSLQTATHTTAPAEPAADCQPLVAAALFFTHLVVSTDLPARAPPLA